MAKFIKTGGRKAGTPNKVTGEARKIIARIANERAEDFESWLILTAAGDADNGVKPDPRGAATLYLAALEFSVPKLQRTELTGEDGGAIKTEAALSDADKDIINRYLSQKEKT